MSNITWPQDALNERELKWSGGTSVRTSVPFYLNAERKRISLDLSRMVSHHFEQKDFSIPQLVNTDAARQDVKNRICEGARSICALCFEIIHSDVQSVAGIESRDRRWALINESFNEHFRALLISMFAFDVVTDLEHASAFRANVGTMAAVNQELCDGLLNAVEPILNNPHFANLSRAEVLAKSGWMATSSHRLLALADALVLRLRQ